MRVLSEKHIELSQTIASQSSSTRMEKGCRCWDFCQSTEDENRLFLLEEWDTQENLMIHLKPERFRVLHGAMNLLEEPYEWGVHTDYRPAELERFNLGSDSLTYLLLPENYHSKQKSSAVKLNPMGGIT